MKYCNHIVTNFNSPRFGKKCNTKAEKGNGLCSLHGGNAMDNVYCVHVDEIDVAKIDVAEIIDSIINKIIFDPSNMDKLVNDKNTLPYLQNNKFVRVDFYKKLIDLYINDKISAVYIDKLFPYPLQIYYNIDDESDIKCEITRYIDMCVSCCNRNGKIMIAKSLYNFLLVNMHFVNSHFSFLEASYNKLVSFKEDWDEADIYLNWYIDRLTEDNKKRLNLV